MNKSESNWDFYRIVETSRKEVQNIKDLFDEKYDDNVVLKELISSIDRLTADNYLVENINKACNKEYIDRLNSIRKSLVALNIKMKERHNIISSLKTDLLALVKDIYIELFTAYLGFPPPVV
jgi:hypothetical protein